MCESVCTCAGMGITLKPRVFGEPKNPMTCAAGRKHVSPCQCIPMLCLPPTSIASHAHSKEDTPKAKG